MIDWQRVAELRDDVGAEDFEDVVTLFLEEVEEVIARLTGAADPDRYAADLHFLKGSALNLGFCALGDACTAAERLAMRGLADAAAIADVIATYEASISDFSSGLAKDHAA